MLSCFDFKEKISFFVEGEIPDSEWNEITSHLQHCPLCLAEAERSRKLETYLSGIEEITPPETMAPQIMSSLMRHQPAQNKKLQSGMVKILAMFVGAFSLPFIVLLLMNIFTVSHQAYNNFFTNQGFLIKLFIWIAKTLSSLFNDFPLPFDFRIALPSFQLLPLALLFFAIVLTVSIFLSSFIFSLTPPKRHLSAKK